MRYITRPTPDNYSVFDKQEELTFMDGLTPSQAEELAYKLNNIKDLTNVTKQDPYINVSEYVKRTKHQDEYFDHRIIYCFDMGFLIDNLAVLLDDIQEKIKDGIEDHCTYELEMTDNKFTDMQNAIKNTLECSFETFLEDIESNIKKADDNDLYMANNVKHLIEDIENILEGN